MSRPCPLLTLALSLPQQLHMSWERLWQMMSHSVALDWTHLVNAPF